MLYPINEKNGNKLENKQYKKVKNYIELSNARKNQNIVSNIQKS